MENTSYIGLSRQIALGRKMDIVANNIANLDTAGFQGERPIFEEFLVDSTNKRELSYVHDFGTWRNTKPGPFIKTGNPYDLAITGETYFVVSTDQGPKFTNNGRFQLSGDGTLVNANGLPVLDVNDEPIIITEEDGQISVSENGIVLSELGEIAQLRIVNFQNPQELKKSGGGLFSTDETPIELTGNENQDIVIEVDFSVKQGFFEASNVQGITEMTRMMDVVRSYTSTANMIKTEHDLHRRAVEKLGQVVSA